MNHFWRWPGGSVRPRLPVDLAGRGLLDAVVADGRGGVEPVGDVGIGQLLDQRRLDRMGGPHARVAVGLELEAHRAGAWALARLDPAVRAEQVLDVVAVLVGDDVGLGERAALRAEALAQLVVEPEIDVHLLVGRAVERARPPTSRVPQPVSTWPSKNTVCAGR